MVSNGDSLVKMVEKESIYQVALDLPLFTEESLRYTLYLENEFSRE